MLTLILPYFVPKFDGPRLNLYVSVSKCHPSCLIRTGDVSTAPKVFFVFRQRALAINSRWRTFRIGKGRAFEKGKKTLENAAEKKGGRGWRDVIYQTEKSRSYTREYAVT